MNREIKFRVWDFRKQEMNYDVNAVLFEMTEKTQYSVNVDKVYGNRTLNVCDFYLDDDGDKILKQKKDAEINQYTGLKDKNGIPIYEGDIVNVNEQRILTTSVEGKYKVFFQAPSFILIKEHENGLEITSIVNPEKYEVIGNIYENPELLK